MTAPDSLAERFLRIIRAVVARTAGTFFFGIIVAHPWMRPIPRSFPDLRKRLRNVFKSGHF